jgi:hypothetical protein
VPTVLVNSTTTTSSTILATTATIRVTPTVTTIAVQLTTNSNNNSNNSTHDIVDVLIVSGHLNDQDHAEGSPGCDPNENDDQQFHGDCSFSLKNEN